MTGRIPYTDVVRWLARLPVLAALIVILVDPIQCADGCSDEIGGPGPAAPTCCALCQRSVEPEPRILSSVQPLMRSHVYALAPVAISLGWRPVIEHPPRGL